MIMDFRSSQHHVGLTLTGGNQAKGKVKTCFAQKVQLENIHHRGKDHCLTDLTF